MAHTFNQHSCFALLIVNFASAALRMDSCPVPCKCYNFMGIQSTYCNRTGITAVPKGIPIDTELLDLSGNMIPKIIVGDLTGLINLNTLVLEAMAYDENSIETGALELPKLTSIDLSNNAYKSIPKTLPKKMNALSMSYNKLSRIAASSFESYSSLQNLNIENCDVEMIEQGTFELTPDLRSLSLSFNKLTDASFPPYVFVHNRNLIAISLRFNQLQHVLPDLPSSIIYLDYVANQIKTLPAFAFKSTPNLQSMEFWEGQITTIEDNAFFGLSKLIILDLMQDKVSGTLTKDTFYGLTGLNTLYMDLNNISHIEPGAFRSFSSIRELWFSDNQLSTLDPEVLNTTYIPHLSMLFIDGNPWYCDCNLRWLREKVGNASYVIQNPHLIVCAGPQKVAGKTWDILQPSDFVC